MGDKGSMEHMGHTIHTILMEHIGNLNFLNSIEHFIFFKPLHFFYLVLHLWDIYNSWYIEHRLIKTKRHKAPSFGLIKSN